MNESLTEIIFLLDRSGSMAGLESDTVGGFNSFIKKQCELEGEAVLTTVLFDNQYEVIWDGMDASKVQLTKEEYFVRGATALLDAVGKTILNVGCRLANTPENEKPGKVIFVITTDGMENASREFTYEKVRKMIRHQQEKYNWRFIFMGANIDAVLEADRLGIDIDHAYRFEATEKGIENMYGMISESVTQIRK